MKLSVVAISEHIMSLVVVVDMIVIGFVNGDSLLVVANGYGTVVRRESKWSNWHNRSSKIIVLLIMGIENLV